MCNLCPRTLITNLRDRSEGNIWFFKTLMKPHITNFLSSCNGIRIPESGRFFLAEKNPIGEFNVRFIHNNNQVQFLFLAIIHTVVSPRTSQLRSLIDFPSLFILFFQWRSQGNLTFCLAGVANVSVRYSKQRTRTRVKDSAKMASRFISRAAKTENPVPQSFFALKPNGNACYAGCLCLIRVFS